jgi:hypothetical protein
MLAARLHLNSIIRLFFLWFPIIIIVIIFTDSLIGSFFLFDATSPHLPTTQPHRLTRHTYTSGPTQAHPCPSPPSTAPSSEKTIKPPTITPP